MNSALGAEFLMNLPGRDEWLHAAGAARLDELLYLVRDAGEAWPAHHDRRDVTCAMLVDSYFQIPDRDRGTVCAATGTAFEDVDRLIARALAMGVTPDPDLDQEAQPAWLLVRRELARWFIENWLFARWFRNMLLIDRLSREEWEGLSGDHRVPEHFVMAAQVYVELRIGEHAQRVVGHDAVGRRLRGLRDTIAVTRRGSRIGLRDQTIQNAIVLAQRHGIPIL